jgi:hypothetical protein
MNFRSDLCRFVNASIVKVDSEISEFRGRRLSAASSNTVNVQKSPYGHNFSNGTPYILISWVLDGENKIKLSAFNQCGTLSLTRNRSHSRMLPLLFNRLH